MVVSYQSYLQGMQMNDYDFNRSVTDLANASGSRPGVVCLIPRLAKSFIIVKNTIIRL